MDTPTASGGWSENVPWCLQLSYMPAVVSGIKYNGLFGPARITKCLELSENYEYWIETRMKWTLAWGTWWDVEKNWRQNTTEKGIFSKLCSVHLISLSDRHGKRQNFSNYKSPELHPKLNNSINDKRDLKISVSSVLLENCYFFQKGGHIGLGSSCCVLSNINWAYQHWETIFHDYTE